MTANGWDVVLPAQDYDLNATLDSGQSFRWQPSGAGWEGVVGGRWLELVPLEGSIGVRTAIPEQDWSWLIHYLQLDLDLTAVLATFPVDGALQRAVCACRGLRLLRQDPWECLASFILSSTKQIVQIRQIVWALTERFGSPLPVLPKHAPVYSFPSYSRLAVCSEAELRACKMGFRAPYLRATAQALDAGRLNLDALGKLATTEARGALMELPGVGRKIADCVLLFAYGFMDAFPVDVWVQRALRQLYFPRRRKTARQLEAFTSSYFGPYAGYAQQYLFHYTRVVSAHE